MLKCFNFSYQFHSCSVFLYFGLNTAPRFAVNMSLGLTMKSDATTANTVVSY